MGPEARAATLFLGWARLEALTGEVEFARKQYRAGLARKNEKPQDVVRLLHSWATLERREGHVKEARSLYNRALQLNGRDHITLHSIAQLELEDGNVKLARTLLQKSLRFSPGDTNSVRALAEVEWKHFAEEGGVDRARELYWRTAQQHRSNASFMRVWAAFEEKQGDTELAERLRSLANKGKR